jgi:hypothetical protein
VAAGGWQRSRPAVAENIYEPVGLLAVTAADEQSGRCAYSRAADRDPGQTPGRVERRLRREPAALHPSPEAPKMPAAARINKSTPESDITQHPPRKAA